MPLLAGETVQYITAVDQMIRIRLLEERLQTLCDIGEGADLHFNRGQEAISVGVISQLRDTDYVVCHHRTIAHAVSKGVPLRPLIAELLGKAEGLNGGMAGEMHMSYPAKRFMFSFQTVGTCVPVAAGIAWAVQTHLGTDDVVAVFHGDAATSNGQWHEGLNLAAVQGLPLLLVCEDNHVAGNVRATDYLPVQHIEERGWAYDIPSVTVDGNDVKQVQSVARGAVAEVRKTRRPFLLVCDTTRLGRHKQGMGDMRSREEMARLAQRDPLRDVDMGQYASVAKELDEIIAEVRGGCAPAFPEGGV